MQVVPLKEYVKGIGAASVDDKTVEFTEATSRTNISSGETFKALFGKIRKWFADLKTVAFSGSYADLTNKPSAATQSAYGFMSAADKTKLDNFRYLDIVNDETIHYLYIGSFSTYDSCLCVEVQGSSSVIFNARVLIGMQNFQIAKTLRTPDYDENVKPLFIIGYMKPGASNGYLNVFLKLPAYVKLRVQAWYVGKGSVSWGMTEANISTTAVSGNYTLP